MNQEQLKHYVYSFFTNFRTHQKDFDATLVYVTDGINMNRRNGSRDFGSNADDNYFRYGGYNEYVKTESNQRRGNVTVATQSVTVEMYKTDLQQNIIK